jgi:S-adenosylmethionine-dependent methyltransferase
MTEIAQAFNQGMDIWKDNQAAPWGKLRYTMVMANLAGHLSKTSQSILDMGGGNGLESMLLAQQGHQITLADFSTEMLVAAQQAIKEAGLAAQISVVKTDIEELPTLFAEASFDVVLLHNVLQYVPNPEAALRSIHHVLRPDGFLSLGIINPYSEVLGPALREFDLATAFGNIDTKVKKVNIFGLEHPLYTLDELNQLLQRTGFELKAHYGVRCLCDYIADNDRKSDPAFFAQLEQLEMAIRDKYPFYLIARFWHVIAEKRKF